MYSDEKLRVKFYIFLGTGSPHRTKVGGRATTQQTTIANLRFVLLKTT